MPAPDTEFSVLETPNLGIRRFRREDAPALAAYRSDREVARFQDWSVPYGESAALEFIDSLGRGHPGVPGEWFQFAIALRETNGLIGDCAMLVDPADEATAEFGCTFAPGHQGAGYATEALGAVLQYAVDTLGIARVIAVTDRENLAAIRLVGRLGFTRRDDPRRAPPSGPLLEREYFYEWQC